MSRGKTARSIINILIFTAVYAFLPAQFSPAQYGYQSIITADAPDAAAQSGKQDVKNAAPARRQASNLQPTPKPSSSVPEKPLTSAPFVSVPDLKAETPAPAKAASPRKLSARSLKSAAEPANTESSYSPNETALPELSENAAPVSAPVKVAQASAEEGATSGLLPEKTDDGILPPPDDYQITQDEAELLDKFLIKWEEFGKNVKKVACSVESKERGGGLYGEDKDIPLSHNFGEFRFIAPNKLLYHIRGEFLYDKEAEGKQKPEYKKGLGEKKFVLDGKSLTEYDFKNRVALVTPIPEDQQNKDLTMDGPIPIFFIAKADNLKRRFYMKIVTKPEKQDKEVWIEAWPRQAADAQTFQRIIITLRLSDLQPYYMRQYHTNGKSYSELWFYDISINKGMWSIEPKIDFGWKREEASPSKVSMRSDAE